MDTKIRSLPTHMETVVKGWTDFDYLSKKSGVTVFYKTRLMSTGDAGDHYEVTV